MPHLPSLPERATLIDLFRLFPETSRPLIEFHEALQRGPSPFTEAERELIATHVSGLNRCRYCQAVHAATTELLGVSGAAVAGLGDPDHASVSEKMKLSALTASSP
ncbi:MAG: hypothetical protein F9K29_19690 [Hyphomicrobiaceae bacterium]|nr:MAG: hypothetical protein F9K29_19690 [Hyphomicrobiaceae bacterium]